MLRLRSQCCAVSPPSPLSLCPENTGEVKYMDLIARIEAFIPGTRLWGIINVPGAAPKGFRVVLPLTDEERRERQERAKRQAARKASPRGKGEAKPKPRARRRPQSAMT